MHTVQWHLGRKVSEVLAPELYTQLEPYLKRALLGEVVPSVELQRPAITPDQPPITLMATYQPVRDEAGEVLGVCASIADISSLKSKEDELRESEDHYRHAVELNPQIPWVLDADGNNIAVSSRWEQVTGLTQEQTKNFGWLAAVHPDDSERTLVAVKDAVNTGLPIDLEYRICGSDGTWIWMRSRGAPRRDAAGEIIRWYGSVESIDDRKRAEDALNSSVARFRAVFNAVPLGLILVDSQSGKMLKANPLAEDLLGFQFKLGMIWSAEGWNASDAHGRSIAELDLPLSRTLRSGEPTDGQELMLSRPDGSRIWVKASAEPVVLDNGDHLGGLLVISEIARTGRTEPTFFSRDTAPLRMDSGYRLAFEGNSAA